LKKKGVRVQFWEETVAGLKKKERMETGAGSGIQNEPVRAKSTRRLKMWEKRGHSYRWVEKGGRGHPRGGKPNKVDMAGRIALR